MIRFPDDTYTGSIKRSSLTECPLFLNPRRCACGQRCGTTVSFSEYVPSKNPIRRFLEGVGSINYVSRATVVGTAENERKLWSAKARKQVVTVVSRVPFKYSRYTFKEHKQRMCVWVSFCLYDSKLEKKNKNITVPDTYPCDNCQWKHVLVKHRVASVPNACGRN